jgi:hypothetical protein
MAARTLSGADERRRDLRLRSGRRRPRGVLAALTASEGGQRQDGGQRTYHDGQGVFARTRSVEAGYFCSSRAARGGRGVSSPPQLGQAPCKRVSAQSRQNVHSNEQIIAS